METIPDGVANSPLALQAMRYIPENPTFLQIVIFHEISSNSQDTTSGLLAQGARFKSMKYLLSLRLTI
jgi:hypothetical protein